MSPSQIWAVFEENKDFMSSFFSPNPHTVRQLEQHYAVCLVVSLNTLVIKCLLKEQSPSNIFELTAIFLSGTAGSVP